MRVLILAGDGRLSRLAAGLALALVAAPAAAAGSPVPLPCEGHPAWDKAYADLPNYDHTGGEALEWLQLRGCPPAWADGRWLPNQDCDPPCVVEEVRVEADGPAAECAACGAPAASARAVARVAVRLAAPPPGAAAADTAAAAPATPECELPTMQLTPARPVVGTVVTIKLLDRETSAEFEDGSGRIPSWSMAAEAGMTVTEPLGRSGSSYQAISGERGTVTFTVAVCGVTDSAGATWVRPRPWWQSPWTGVVAGAVVGAWHVWPRGERP